jgi:hypothetical protein
MGTKSQTKNIWTSIVYLLDNLSFFQKTYESCREIQNASKSTISEIIRKPTIVVSLLCQFFFFGDYLKKEQSKIKTKKNKTKKTKKSKNKQPWSWSQPPPFTQLTYRMARWDIGWFERLDLHLQGLWSASIQERRWIVTLGLCRLAFFSVGIIRWSPPRDTVLTQVFIGEMFYKHFFRSYVLYMNDWWWFFIEIRNPNVSDKVFSWISLIYKSAIKKIIGQFY